MIVAIANQKGGSYRLTLAQTPGAFVVPAGDEGGALTTGVNHEGTIHVGDLDQWTFTAAVGETIALSLTETGVATDFLPWLRLRGPNGAQLASEAGVSTAHVNVTARAAGTLKAPAAPSLIAPLLWCFREPSTGCRRRMPTPAPGVTTCRSASRVVGVTLSPTSS